MRMLPYSDARNVSRIQSSEELFIECVWDTFFYQHVNEDTRYRNGIFSSLDLLFINEASTIERLALLDPLGASDHAAIQFKILLKSQGEPSVCSYKPIYCKRDYVINFAQWWTSIGEKPSKERMSRLLMILLKTPFNYKIMCTWSLKWIHSIAFDIK